MKNILLIGDSICYGAPPNSPGYGVLVQEKLKGIANVYKIDDNCRFVQYTLRYLWDWVRQVDAANIDVIHWNNGLWDVLRLNGDEPLNPCDVYVDTLERIYYMLKKLFPKAKIIFATSTAVIEAKADPTFFRKNVEIEQYNQAAIKRLAPLGVEVNDLYAITKDFDDSLHSDWVHFNTQGSDILAGAVAQRIMAR